MKYHKGFALGMTLLIILGILVLGAAGYVAMNPQVLQTLQKDGVQTAPGDHPEVDHDANEGVTADEKSSISWSFTSAGEVQGMPYTNVTVVINGKAYEVGKLLGSCTEVGANGGIDGKGLLAGELSAAQCWFAGGGNEAGVFANENGGFEIMIGVLEEGQEGSPMFRGNFKIKSSITI